MTSAGCGGLQSRSLRAKKPLPNKSSIQGVPTTVMDNDDHIWVLNRPYDINLYELGAATNRQTSRIAGPPSPASETSPSPSKSASETNQVPNQSRSLNINLWDKAPCDYAGKAFRHLGGSLITSM
jgi:hypothetical protein